MNTIPTVTIALSAYNEAENIGRFLQSVLEQKENGFILEKILVISDGSDDSTISVAKSISSPKIEVREYPVRAGKSARLNEIYDSLTSDILVQSDADITFAHPGVVAAMVAALSSGESVGMCGGRPQPLPAQTWTEKAVNLSTRAYDRLRETFRGGNNVLSADGRLLAFRRDLVKNLHIPEDMITNDMFAYFSCLKAGREYRFVPEAVVHFRSPQTLRDQIRQNTRFVAGPLRMEKYFGDEIVARERSIPFSLFARTALREFFSHPILASYIFAVNLYCRAKAKMTESQLSAKWQMALSTKKLQ